MNENTKKDSNSMTTDRIETLVDGIFAIAMTLLVLTLEVPQLPSPVTNATIYNFLFSLWPQFFVYGLSFALLAVFWRMNHKEFHRIKRSDSVLLRINISWLMFVVLVPFSTSLMGDYTNFQAAELFFHFNMFMVGIFAFINWFYATNWGLTDDKLTKKDYRTGMAGYLLLPFLAIIAMGLTFITPSWSSLAYLGIGLFRFVKRII